MTSKHNIHDDMQLQTHSNSNIVTQKQLNVDTRHSYIDTKDGSTAG